MLVQVDRKVMIQDVFLMVTLGLAEVREDRIDELKGLIDLLADLGASEHNLARYEDEKHNLRLHHPVDQARKQFGLVRAEHVMTTGKTFETDRELDVAGADDVLDLEVGELRIESKLLDDAGILAASKLAVILRLRAGHDHLARGEDEGGRLRFTNAHDHRCETLRIVLRVARMKCDRLEVKSAIEVHRSYDIPLSRVNTKSQSAEA